MTTRQGTEYQSKSNKKYFSSLKELYEVRKKYFQNEPATFVSERFVGEGLAGLIDTSVRLPINYPDNERDKILSSTFLRMMRMYKLESSVQVCTDRTFNWLLRCYSDSSLSSPML